MDASPRFGDGNTLDAVDAALVFETAEGAAALDFENRLFDAADSDLIQVHEIDLPAAPVRIEGIHAKQLTGEERGFITAGRRSNLDNGVLLVVWVRGYEGNTQLFEQSISPRFQLVQRVAGQLSQIRVSAFRQPVARFGNVGFDPLQLAHAVNGWHQLVVFPRIALQRGHVRYHIGVRHEAAEFLVALFQRVQAIDHGSSLTGPCYSSLRSLPV